MYRYKIKSNQIRHPSLFFFHHVCFIGHWRAHQANTEQNVVWLWKYQPQVPVPQPCVDIFCQGQLTLIKNFNRGLGHLWLWKYEWWPCRTNSAKAVEWAEEQQDKQIMTWFSLFIGFIYQRYHTSKPCDNLYFPGTSQEQGSLEDRWLGVTDNKHIPAVLSLLAYLEDSGSFKLKFSLT